jgi:hypothetical protein
MAQNGWKYCPGIVSVIGFVITLNGHVEQGVGHQLKKVPGVII